MVNWRQRIEIFFIPFVVFTIAYSLAEYIVRLDSARQHEIQRNQVMADASALRAQLEGEVNATIFLANGLGGYVSAYGNLDDGAVNVVLATVFQYGRHLRNIALAPNNIIRFIYPQKGNEQALGLAYEHNAQQWPPVKRAMETHSTVVAGPVDLVQGGRGLISRTPVYQPDGRYWGIVSLIMKIDSLFASLDSNAKSSGIVWALRGKDGQGAKGGMIHGKAGLFSGDNVRQIIRIPGGTWEMAVMPENGWQLSTTRTSILRLGGIALSLLIAGLTYFVVSERIHIRHLATHDPLTNLPNRRLLSDRLAQAIAKAQRDDRGFAILSMDLDNFKPINDQHGHQIGDQVLCTIASRLQKCLRSIDTVARIGGDEFLMVLPDAQGDLEVREVAQRVASAIREPIHIGNLLLQTSASIGICHYPGDGQTEDELMRVTDEAMYSAKRQAKGSVYQVGELLG